MKKKHFGYSFVSAQQWLYIITISCDFFILILFHDNSLIYFFENVDFLSLILSNFPSFIVAVMHDKPCKMGGLFGEGMRDTHKVLFVAEKLIHHYLSRLARHFDKEHVHLTMYATQWLLTQFTSNFKFDLVFRVWDAFLGEGWKIIYRVMLALMQKYQSQLLKMSFEDILTFFRELPTKIDGNQIMDMALKIPLRKKVMAKYENEWESQQQEQHQ
jgi:hypothetical protein